jgi:ketosteroid isomerase-like protein
MYKIVVKAIVRRGFRAISRGDFDAVLGMFTPKSRFWFAGDHALSGERRGREEVRAWFEETWARFPGLQIEARDVLVNGWPWDTRIASHLRIHAVLQDGRPYENAGMQYVHLRWGKIVEDLIYEDTQKIAAELERQHTVAAR